MLYDFHSHQNAQKVNSVHATYLVYGTKSSANDQSDDDVEMTSSMPEPEATPISTLTLVREEDLNDILATYQEVTSIHVYSLAPHPQKDFSLLSDLTAQLSEYATNGDITTASKKYGVISNPNARRRERKGRPQAPVSVPSKPVKKEPVAANPASTTKPKQEASAAWSEAKHAKTAKQESSAPPSKEGTTATGSGKKPTAALKRGASGGIMQSFAKAAAKPAKPKPAPQKEEDSAMALSDDGEADDDDIVATKLSSKPGADSSEIKRKRQEREDALRKMMEDDDEDEKESDRESEQIDEEMEEAPEPEPELKANVEQKEPAEVVSSTSNGRRRGRRRVMKKKRILDDQGYMVTIQEPGWESFSEDEAPLPAKKPAPAPTPSSSTGSRAKKPAPKGQGNIMSFFAKK
ncbi:CDC27 protein [Fusarium equiseti]|uniref:DNA polymerase delta subunit 3 n=1 Tax=Fusarium equiseti TaxID=61235 RepID=A0ABQ8QWI0_FUSEQ|nr:CDC27 protein [Fusarium equiseti]